MMRGIAQFKRHFNGSSKLLDKSTKPGMKEEVPKVLADLRCNQYEVP
jgi:hypothetical protein